MTKGAVLFIAAAFTLMGMYGWATTHSQSRSLDGAIEVAQSADQTVVADSYIRFFKNRHRRVEALARQLNWPAVQEAAAAEALEALTKAFEAVEAGYGAVTQEKALSATEEALFAADLIEANKSFAEALRSGFCEKFALKCLPGFPPDEVYIRKRSAKTTHHRPSIAPLGHRLFYRDAPGII